MHLKRLPCFHVLKVFCGFISKTWRREMSWKNTGNGLWISRPWSTLVLLLDKRAERSTRQKVHLTSGKRPTLTNSCWILSDQVKKLLERCLLPEISIIKAQDMEFSSRMMVKHNKSIKLLISPVSQWAGSVHVDVKDTDIRHVSKYTTTFKKLLLPCQYHSFRIDRVLRACRHFQVSEK